MHGAKIFYTVLAVVLTVFFCWGALQDNDWTATQKQVSVTWGLWLLLIIFDVTFTHKNRK